MDDSEYEYTLRWRAILFGLLLCGGAATVADLLVAGERWRTLLPTVK
jgi:hypothetical protein